MTARKLDWTELITRCDPATLTDSLRQLIDRVVLTYTKAGRENGYFATPADAALMMQMGADGVFIGSGIFKSGNPAQRAAACVKATTFFNDAKVLADVSRGLGDAMVGINVADIPVPHRLAERGW